MAHKAEGLALTLAQLATELGLVPEKYPVCDPEPERRLRERLRVVLQGGTPTLADASLLVVGARGLGGCRGLIVGSVSQRCLEHAPCPVGIVPPRDRPGGDD